MIASSTEDQKKEVGERLMKSLHGEPVAPPKQPKLTRDEHFTVKLFRGFTEIHACIERLKDCETYIGRFPFKGTRVSRAAYLQHVVETHLHELYILRERLIGYATLIRRQYRHDRNAQLVDEVTTLLEEYVSTAFAGFTRVRGSHVHQFRHSNDDIERLELLALLQKGGDKHFSNAIRILGRTAIPETHMRLKAQAKKWNSSASKALEEYFKALLPLVFTADAKAFRYPGAKP
jgi:hypothetical protein